MSLLVQTKEIVSYIEYLRELRNITQEDLLHDIISLRQYRRYLRGESTITYKVISELSNRLNFKVEHLLLDFEQERILENRLTIELYNSVIQKNTSLIHELSEKMNKGYFIDEINHLLYSHSMIINDYYQNRVSKIHAVNEIVKLINFDQLIQKKVFSIYELLILVSLFTFENFQHNNLIAQKLRDFLTSDLVLVSGQNIRSYVLVYQQLALYNGLQKDFEKMIEYCDMGINYSIKFRSFYLLEQLYYFKAYGLYYLNEQNDIMNQLDLCFAVLKLENNPSKIDKYQKLVKKEFGIDFKI